MKPDYPKRQVAAAEFLRVLVEVAFRGAIEDTVRMLKEGPVGRKPKEELLDLHQWYRQLDSTSQQKIETIIKEAVHSSVFETLVLLDGASGLFRVQGKPADFALYLQVYSDPESLWSDSPEFTVRINPLRKEGDELHDLFQSILER